jgi:hypothetical protein
VGGIHELQGLRWEVTFKNSYLKYKYIHESPITPEFNACIRFSNAYSPITSKLNAYIRLFNACSPIASEFHAEFKIAAVQALLAVDGMSSEQRKPCHFCCLHGVELWTSRVCNWNLFKKNGDSITATRRVFRRNFEVGRHGRVPDRKTILLWVGNFRETGSALKQKSSGRPRSVRTP